MTFWKWTAVHRETKPFVCPGIVSMQSLRATERVCALMELWLSPSWCQRILGNTSALLKAWEAPSRSALKWILLLSKVSPFDTITETLNTQYTMFENQARSSLLTNRFFYFFSFYFLGLSHNPRLRKVRCVTSQMPSWNNFFIFVSQLTILLWILTKGLSLKREFWYLLPVTIWPL